MSNIIKRIFASGISDEEVSKCQLVATERTASLTDSKRDWYCADARYFELRYISISNEDEGPSCRFLKAPEDLPKGPDRKSIDPSLLIHIGKLMGEERNPPSNFPPIFPAFMDADWPRTVTKLWLEDVLTVEEWNRTWRQLFKKMRSLTRLTLDLKPDAVNSKPDHSKNVDQDSKLTLLKAPMEKIAVNYQCLRSTTSKNFSVLVDDFIASCAAMLKDSHENWLKKSEQRSAAFKPELCFECHAGDSISADDGTVRALDGFRLEFNGSKCYLRLVDLKRTTPLPLQIGHSLNGELNTILGHVKPRQMSTPSTEFLASMSSEATANLVQLEVDTIAPVEGSISNAAVAVSNMSKNPAFAKLTELRIRHRGREEAPPLKKLAFERGSYNSLEGVASLRLIRSIEDLDAEGKLGKNAMSKLELGHSKRMWELVLPYFLNVKKFTTNGPRRSCIRQAKMLYREALDGRPPTLEDLTMYVFVDECDRFWAGTRADWKFKEAVVPNRDLVEGFNLTSLTIHFNKYWDEKKALKRARAMVRDCGDACSVRLIKFYASQFKEDALLDGLEKPEWLKVVVKSDYSYMKSAAFQGVTLGWT